MKRYLFGPILLFAGLYLSGVYSPAPLTAAPTIWNGPDFTFTKAPFADPTLPANQDRMTANVWITRASARGLYNAKTETAYINLVSPDDTEWSYGELANFASLTYQPWESVYGGSGGGGPPATLNRNMVVHLKSEDIYLSIKLLTWGVRDTSGGSFSYVRSTPGSAPPTPVTPRLSAPVLLGDGSVRFSFTNLPGHTFTIRSAPNIALPFSSWTVLGTVTNTTPGQYQFTDPGAATNSPAKYYRIQWP